MTEQSIANQLEDKENLINCVITKNVSYDTYIFRGSGSKNLLKYFIEQTKEYKIITIKNNM